MKPILSRGSEDSLRLFEQNRWLSGEDETRSCALGAVTASTSNVDFQPFRHTTADLFTESCE